jgi:hypothetical protein
MTTNFEDLLPEGTRQAMLNERIGQLAAEGLANELAKIEAQARGDEAEVARYDENIQKILTSLQANQAQLS